MAEGPPYEIIWSTEAINNPERIVNYLFYNWNEKVVNDFLGKVDDKLLLISHHPFIVSASSKDINIRSVLISKHNRLYYSVYNNTIGLLNIFDTRQNPKRNPY